MSNILESYFVSLGFETDEVGFRKFDEVLNRAAETVERHTKGITLNILKLQTGILGAFTAVSGAIVGMIDHLAMADQGYRLLGLHSLMSADSAEKLERITKALGVTLEDIVWDPTGELQGRAKVLAADIDAMKGFLGADYKEKSRQVRDIVFQFERLKNLLPDLGRLMMIDIFKAFGLDLGNVSTKFSDFVQNVEKNAPVIAQKFTNIVVPVLKDTWDMLKLMGQAVQVFTTGVMHLIGVFSGDKELANAPLTFDNMSEAILHVIQAMKDLFDWITKAEIGIGHLFNAIALAMARNWSGAADELKTAVSEITGMFGDVTDHVETSTDRIRASVSGMVSDQMRAHGWAEAPNAFMRGMERGAAPEWLSAAWGWLTNRFEEHNPRSIREWHNLMSRARSGRDEFRSWVTQNLGIMPWVDPNDRASVQKSIEAVAKRFEVPEALALAVAKQESGFQQFDKAGKVTQSNKGALGIFQLMPDTARDLIVNPRDTGQNITGGTVYLAELLDHYHGNQLEAAAAFNAGAQRVDDAIARFGSDWLAHLPDETKNYVPNVMKFETQFERSSQAIKSLDIGVSHKEAEKSLAHMAKTPVAPYKVPPVMYQHKTDVGGVSIHINQPGASAEQIKDAVREGVWEAQNRQIQSDLAHIGGTY